MIFEDSVGFFMILEDFWEDLGWLWMILKDF